MQFEYIQTYNCGQADIDRIAKEGYRLVHVLDTPNTTYIFERIILNRPNTDYQKAA